MLWTSDKRYSLEPFDKEADLETAIHEVSAGCSLFPVAMTDHFRQLGGYDP